MSNFNEVQDEIIAGNGFFAVPISIFQSDQLSATEILLITVIMSLSTKTGYCYATNKTLARFARCSDRQVTRMIADWKARSWLSSILEIDQASKQVLSRKIVLNSRKVLEDTYIASLSIPPDTQSIPSSRPVETLPTPSLYPPDSQSSIIDNIINNKINNKIDLSQPAVVPQPKAKSSIFDIKDSITKEQYQAILTDPTLCDNDRNYLYECAKEMEDWSKAGLKKKVDWAAALRNWVRGNRRKGIAPTTHSKAASGPKTFKQLDEERDALEWAQTQQRMKEKFGKK